MLSVKLNLGKGPGGLGTKEQERESSERDKGWGMWNAPWLQQQKRECLYVWRLWSPHLREPGALPDWILLGLSKELLYGNSLPPGDSQPTSIAADSIAEI